MSRLSHVARCTALCGLMYGAVACDQQKTSSPLPPTVTPELDEPVKVAPPVEDAITVTRPAYKLSGVARGVAVGDVHGDLSALKAALFAARLIDSDGHWIGQDAVLVQTGDLLDRGDDEQEIIDFLDQLGKEASAQKGAVMELIGNHEAMNVQGDLRYVTPGGFKDFEDVEGLKLDDPALTKLPETARARRAAFMPRGPYAVRLAHHNTIGIVNDTVFAHGGILPEHVAYGVEKLNGEVSAWMLGRGEFPAIMQGESAPTWTRYYSAPKADPCPRLHQTLDVLGVARMVVGHTPQMGGVTSKCDGKLWLVDVGMASHYGGSPAALEILESGETQVLTAPPQK
jgi:hypothetical protein